MVMLLDTSTAYEDWVDGEFANADELESLNIITFLGQPQNHRFPPTTFIITSEPTPPDIFDFGIDTIVSRGIMQKFQTATSLVEYLPIDVKYRGEMMPSGSYFIMNILDMAECIDRMHSKLLIEDDGYIKSIESLRLDENACLGHELCRAVRCLPKVICISDKLAQELISENWRGVLIRPQEQWRNCGYRGYGR